MVDEYTEEDIEHVPEGEEWLDDLKPSADRSSTHVPLGESAGMCVEKVSSGNSSQQVNPICLLDVEGIQRLEAEPIADGIIDICQNLYFRQSLVKDYLACPQMMLYKWIIGHEEEDTFMAALLGTAGHSVIEMMHSERNVKNFTYTTIDLQTAFVKYAEDALRSSSVPPRVSAKFKTVSAQMNAAAPEYIQLIQGYAHDKRNQDFHATVCEQMFALAVEFEGQHYLFTGTIDQAGYYADGTFALRDIKFRDSHFKPGHVQLQLDMQLTLYAYAIKHGVPACQTCKPRYSVEGELEYTGPCPECKAKIGTAAWPGLLAERSELVWMRDYAPKKRDEYAKYITSETEFEINPATGRKRKKRVMNEAWVHGYKKGDPSGKAILVSQKSVAFLNVRMVDLIRVCKMIKTGQFYRKEGEHCNFWCKFKQPGMDMLETQVQEIDVTDFNNRVATLDPFGDS